MKKPLLLSVPVTVISALLACVGAGGDNAIRVTDIYPTDNACTIKTDIAQSGGSLDLAAIRQAVGGGAVNAANYLVTVSAESDFSVPVPAAGGNQLADESRNRVYLNQIQLRYETNPPSSVVNDTVDIFAPIDAKGSINMVMNLLGRQAAQTFLNTIGPGSGATQLRVFVKFRGTHPSGTQNNEIFSNEFMFPISIYDSGFTCTGDFRLTCQDGRGPGPCGSLGGQDDFPLCVKLDAGC